MDGSMSPIVSRVTGLLSSDAPDIAEIHDILREADWPEDEITQFVYGTVLKINRSLFTPVTHMELLLAEGCDMACSYCFESAILDTNLKRRRVMQDEVINRAVDLLFDYAGPRNDVNVTLFGGEPTLNFRGIRTAVERVEKYSAERGTGHVFNMTSNALHMTQEMIDYLAAHNVRVLVSVDGMRESHDRYRKDKSGQGTFDRVMANIRRLKEQQPWIGVKITVMPSEADAMFANVRALYDAGVNQFIIGEASGVEWSEAQTAALMDQWRQLRQWWQETNPKHFRVTDFEKKERSTGGPKFGCGAARNTIAVNVAGEISGCSKIISLEFERAVGKLGDVWNGLYQIRARADMAGCGKLIRNCEDAGIADNYGGGCFATNFEETGDLFRPNLDDHRRDRARNDMLAETSG